MKKSALFVCAVAVSVLAIGTAAHAASKFKAKEMTCEQFLALGTEDQPRVVYWLEGFSKSGKLEDAEIDVDSFDRPVAMLVTECRKAPKATVWEKIKDHF